MTRNKYIVSLDEVKELMEAEPDILKAPGTKLIQDALEAEMEEAFQAAKS